MGVVVISLPENTSAKEVSAFAGYHVITSDQPFLLLCDGGDEEQLLYFMASQLI